MWPALAFFFMRAISIGGCSFLVFSKFAPEVTDFDETPFFFRSAFCGALLLSFREKEVTLLSFHFSA